MGFVNCKSMVIHISCPLDQWKINTIEFGIGPLSQKSSEPFADV